MKDSAYSLTSFKCKPACPRLLFHPVTLSCSCCSKVSLFFHLIRVGWQKCWQHRLFESIWELTLWRADNNTKYRIALGPVAVLKYVIWKELTRRVDCHLLSPACLLAPILRFETDGNLNLHGICRAITPGLKWVFKFRNQDNWFFRIDSVIVTWPLFCR